MAAECRDGNFEKAGAMAMAERVQIGLDGVWQFSHEGGPWRDAVVPMPWAAAFADLRNSFGRARYQRHFARPNFAPGQQVVLRFGAVSDSAEVFVNGTRIGQHQGGYLPFDCVVPPDILQDINELRVDCHLPEDAAFAQIPHGKQSWYGPLGGIWQSVVLEVRANSHLAHCAIRAEISGQVSVDLQISGTDEAVLFTVTDPDGAIVLTSDQPQFTLPKPRLWCPEDPALYTLHVQLAGGDATRHSFGFRQFEARGGQFVLNGQPFYMRAALDQDYYPEGICTPPSVAFLEDQLRKAKHLGLNMLRCHIKVPDPAYYDAADRMGMLIWTEVPNVASLTAQSKARMRAVMEGILARDGNHPSIVIWTLINEDWGTRLCEDPAHRAWLAAEYDWLRQRDPSRLVVDNSPCNGNFHVKTDINDFHYYRSVPERRAEWDALTAEFAQGADWTFTPFGDGQRRGDEPLVVSEFGVWGLPQPAQVTLAGAEPWWMETGGTWGEGVAYPHGVQHRFAALQLDRVFGNFEAFITAAQWYQFANLKYQIEVMRGWPQIQGYVITEFTDVHWESNGLLDMNRNPRVFHDRFAQINSDLVIVPKLDRYAGYAGESVRVDLSVATGGQPLQGAVLRWSLGADAGAELAVPPTPALSLAEVGTLDVALPSGGNAIATLSLTLHQDGVEVARNQVEIAVYQRDVAAEMPAIFTEDARLLAHATALGCRAVPRDQAQVVLVRNLSPQDIQALQNGARYLVMLGEDTESKEQIRTDPPRREPPGLVFDQGLPGIPGSADGQLPNMALHPRHGSMWRGDWIAGFSWLRRQGPFADIPGGPLVDLSFDRVIPRQVLTGFRTWEFGSAVHAGVVVGWVHKPAAFVAERRVGQGALVASTFRLTGEAPGADPVARALTRALLQLAAASLVEGY